MASILATPIQPAPSDVRQRFFALLSEEFQRGPDSPVPDPDLLLRRIAWLEVFVYDNFPGINPPVIIQQAAATPATPTG